VAVLCVNCDGPLLGGGVLYCSNACEQEAGYVRYHRQVLADGRWLQPEIQEALRIRAVVVMNGGYPQAERRLPAGLRKLILERDGHICQMCSGPGQQVDHIRLRGVNHDINHPRNLQVLCGACHRAKTLADIRLISHRDDPDLWRRLNDKSAELERRVRADPAERTSDDEQRWPSTWRALQRTRRDELQRLRPRDVARTIGHLRLVR
jgi:5-methylcytosine-specific restriction endonuclease McrA